MHNQEKTLPPQMKTKALVVKGVNSGTRNLSSLYDGVFITERMGRRERHRSVTGLCTLAISYNMPGREPKGYGWL